MTVTFIGGPHDGATHHTNNTTTLERTLERTLDHGDHTRTYRYELTAYVGHCVNPHHTHRNPCPTVFRHLYRFVREEITR